MEFSFVRNVMRNINVGLFCGNIKQ